MSETPTQDRPRTAHEAQLFTLTQVTPTSRNHRRSTQHYAVSDYFPQVRRMMRATVIGERPF